MSMALLYEEETYAIWEACFEVYKEQGPGFLEAVYQECLEIELGQRGVQFVAQPELILKYKGHKRTCVYKSDFLCFGKIVVEIKAVSELCDALRAQVHHYLRATDMRLGLVNFTSHPKLEYERIIR